MTSPIITRRITIPPLPNRLVERSHLEARLAGLVESHRVVIVSATAGAGKTTSVVRGLARLDRPISWLTVDAADRAPGRLLTYLEAALATNADLATDSLQGMLADGVPHEEAAGLLLEQACASAAVLVLDEVDRIQPAPAAWTIVEALARYVPDTMRLVLISRRPVQLESHPPSPGEIGWVLEEDLAFDADGVQDVLAMAGNHELEPSDVMHATAGWVTGVIFDAWRRPDQASRLGGAVDPLHGYLAAQILAALPEDDQEFLIRTSVLDEVSTERATELGFADATQRLASLRRANLPGTWAETGDAFRCHSRFREFLASLLEERPQSDVAQLHHAHGLLLAREGLPEEAVTALLTAGALPEAALAAERALPLILDRGDLEIADRWLRRFKALDVQPLGIVEAEVILAAGREDFLRVAELAEQLEGEGRFQELIAKSARTAALIAWASAHVGRLDAVHRILAGSRSSPETTAIRYMLHLIEPQPRAAVPVPRFTGGPLDALVIRDHYIYGRLDRVLAETRAGWVGAVTSPWQIAALRAMGQVSRAAELLVAARASGEPPLGLLAIVGPEVLLDAGDSDAAWELVESSVPLARAKGSALFVCLNRCVAAKIALRGRRDATLALRIIEELETHEVASYRYVSELLRTWKGHALLEGERDDEALAELEFAVASMSDGDRMLELPTAAVYLAEARWRTGDEIGSDAAADLALQSAERQGSDHLLLQALSDFPSVLSRRLDAEADADSVWHRLGRSLQAPTAGEGSSTTSHPAHLHDLGRPSLVVNGEPVRARLSKALEILAFLKSQPRHEATRAQLMDALFDGRADESARSYLRQAIHGLRHALPPDQVETTSDGRVVLTQAGAIISDADEAAQWAHEASRLHGPSGLRALRAAVALLAEGDYLAGCESAWVGVRRDGLARTLEDARYAAAELAYAEGIYGEAREMAEEILQTDPYKEAVWRLRMRIAGALGDEVDVIDAFRRCREALADLGAQVAPATSALLSALRR